MQMRARHQQPQQLVAAYMYDKLQLFDEYDMLCAHVAVKPYLLAGMRDRAHAAILTLQPPLYSPVTFNRQARELESVNTVTKACQPTISQGSSTRPQLASQPPFKSTRSCCHWGDSGSFTYVLARPLVNKCKSMYTKVRNPHCVSVS